MGYKLLIFITLLISNISFAGPSVSGGGGGGNLSITSKFAPAGSLSVSMFSKGDGALAVVLKYFVLAGAQQNNNAIGSNFAIPGASDMMFANNSQYEVGMGYKYQVNMVIAADQLQEVRSGLNNTTAATTFSFSGTLADALYRGMDKSGIANSGKTLDANNQVLGFIYNEGALYCEKRVTAVCSVTMKQ